MYLVNFKKFTEYIKFEKLKNDPVVITQVPCILIFKRDKRIKAKIEIADLSAFRWNEKFGLKNFKESKNKYWIRGVERPELTDIV